MHFKEVEAGGDRVDFTSGNLMNDVDGWALALNIEKEYLCNTDEECKAEDLSWGDCGPGEKRVRGLKGACSAYPDHIKVYRSLVTPFNDFNYEIEVYGFSFDVINDRVQKYSTIKAQVWSGGNTGVPVYWKGAMVPRPTLSTDELLVVKAPVSPNANLAGSVNYIWTLGGSTGLKLKAKLVGMSDADRGAKGLKKTDPSYAAKVRDGAFKLYQDRIDVICLCNVRMRKSLLAMVSRVRLHPLPTSIAQG